MAAPLKDLYTGTYIREVAKSIQHAHAPFDAEAFVKTVLGKPWKELELKGRMRHIATSLHGHLALPYPKALEVISKAAETQQGFLSMFFPDFVQVYGAHDPELSLEALKWLTRFSSSEFAVRPFILQHPDYCLGKLKSWTGDENHHVRRWCSEGCRPRLPWAMALPALQKDPSPILPILHDLLQDESEYVRRSVANNLNDISKDHPQLVVELARKWKGKSEETDKLLKHATRTLLKKGRQDALEIFGVAESKHLSVSSFRLGAAKVSLGESVSFQFSISNSGMKKVAARIEYVIHFRKANGSLSAKVFQVAQRDIMGGDSIEMERRHRFADLTTRKHYAGKHILAIHVNGRELARKNILLSS